MKKLAACILVALALTACGKKQEEEVAGVYVEISLKNTGDIDKYVVFNPNVTTIEECQASFESALPSVMANLPAAIPKDSVATGWKCYLKDPSKK